LSDAPSDFESDKSSNVMMMKMTMILAIQHHREVEKGRG
jgi:hypothetical protein